MRHKTEVEIARSGPRYVTVYIDMHGAHNEYILTNAEYDEWREAFGHEV